MTPEEANAILPQQPTKGIIRPERLKYFIIAPPKFGKTTTATMIPNSILLAFEEGHAFTECFKIIIDQWDRPFKDKQEGVGQDEDGNMHMSFAEAVALICASDRFDNILIDTADMMTRMCTDYWCNHYKVKHPSEAGDFGKGFALCITDPLRRMLGPLIKSGRGITFISHSKWVQPQQEKGKPATVGRWESTLPSQAQAFIHSQVDVIWHGKFGKLRPGQEERDRILSTDAAADLMAGSRVRINNRLWPIPKSFILDPENGWDQWSSFFPVEGRTEDEARHNCEQAYNQYLHLVLGRAGIEKEAVVAASANDEPMPVNESPAPTEAAEPEAPMDTAHLESPRGLKRVKPVKS